MNVCEQYQRDNNTLRVLHNLQCYRKKQLKEIESDYYTLRDRLLVLEAELENHTKADDNYETEHHKIKASLENESYSAFLNAINDYRKLREEISDLEKEKSASSDESYIKKLDKQLKKLKDNLEDAEDIAEHNYAIWTAKMGQLNLDIPEQKEIFNKMNQVVYYWEYFSGKIKKELKDIVNDPNYAVVKQHLIDLWKQGKLTEEEFSKLTDETVS